MLSAQNIRFSVGKKELLHGVSVEVPTGSFVGLIGPNGCGKSTLLKTIYRAYRADAGAVYINGQALSRLSNREMARRMAVVPQENELDFDFTVMEIMRIGRYAHRRPFAPQPQGEEALCLEALRAVGMEGFQDRSFLSLSGGEKQRVLIASAFSRGTRLLLLDEPVNHLDIGYQFLILDSMKRHKGTTIFVSLHDMDLAFRYCDQVVAMERGEVAAAGPPEEVITPRLLGRLYGVKAQILRDETGGRFVHYQGIAPRG